MAEVAKDRQSQALVDEYLHYLLREWRALPRIAAEWGQWQDHEQLDFVVEWPIREDRLAQLRSWVEQGILTPAQRARYDELVSLIAANRPILARLLNE